MGCDLCQITGTVWWHNLPPCKHRVPTWGHNMHAQRKGTTWGHNMHAQLKDTTWGYNVRTQHEGTSWGTTWGHNTRTQREVQHEDNMRTKREGKTWGHNMRAQHACTTWRTQHEDTTWGHNMIAQYACTKVTIFSVRYRLNAASGRLSYGRRLTSWWHMRAQHACTTWGLWEHNMRAQHACTACSAFAVRLSCFYIHSEAISQFLRGFL